MEPVNSARGAESQPVREYMLAYFLPAVPYAPLYPIGVTAKLVSPVRGADSQPVSQQMLSRALRARPRAMSEHGAPAPYPITREEIRGEGETHTPAEDNAQTRLMERCNLEEPHATLPTSRPVGTCPHTPAEGAPQ